MPLQSTGRETTRYDVARMTAIRAYAAGVLMVVRAPGVVIVVFLVTLLSAVPFALVLGERLNAVLAEQQVSGDNAAQIDAEWWQEFRRHARGLDATFTPDIIGFAAPLSNLSALVDGEWRPLILLLPIAIYAVVWVLLWGGVLARFVRGQPLGIRGFIRAGTRYFVPFLIIGVAAVIVSALLYATVHRVLFGPVFAWLASMASTEQAAFFWRVALYAVFGVLLLSVTAAADFARVVLVVGRGTEVPRDVPTTDAARTAIGLIRSRPATVFGVYLLNGIIFAAVLALYGAAEIIGGAHVGGWRAVLLGQAYIGVRLVLRLVLAASTVALTQKA